MPKKIPEKQGKNKGRDNLLKGQWKPGQSGNPKGRPPKVKCIPDILKKIGEEDGRTVDGHTKLEVIMRKVYIFALEGRPWAVQFIADRMEGKPMQSLNIHRAPQDEIEVVDIE